MIERELKKLTRKIQLSWGAITVIFFLAAILTVVFMGIPKAGEPVMTNDYENW